MKKIASFTIDHLNLFPGLYLSRRDAKDGVTVTTFDLRFTAPNREPAADIAALHTIEHLLATVLRNGREKDNIVYFGPMGCRTGFYLLTLRLGYDEVLALLKEAIPEALALSAVPGSAKKECGNYLEHDLADAKRELCAYLAVLEQL